MTISYNTIFLHFQNKQAEKITNTVGRQQLDNEFQQMQRHSFRYFLETLRWNIFDQLL